MTRAAWYRAQAEEYGTDAVAYLRFMEQAKWSAVLLDEDGYLELIVTRAWVAFHFAICALDAERDEEFTKWCRTHPKDHWPGAGRGVHGETCPKAAHTDPTGGYLHAADDDRPYDVDGVTYCGRCHAWVGEQAKR